MISFFETIFIKIGLVISAVLISVGISSAPITPAPIQLKEVAVDSKVEGNANSDQIQDSMSQKIENLEKEIKGLKKQDSISLKQSLPITNGEKVQENKILPESQASKEINYAPVLMVFYTQQLEYVNSSIY